MPIAAGEKFELRLIRSTDILLHEYSENDRSSRLARRLREEKILYNPLIIGRHKHRYVLIDGANRFEALKRLNCGIILGQIVEYMNYDVLLKSWFHFVYGLKLDELVKFLGNSRIVFNYIKKLRRPLPDKEILVYSKQGNGILIKLDKDLKQLLSALSRINWYYENKYYYSRVDSDIKTGEITRISDAEGILVMYPEFSKRKILNIAGQTEKLPAGITRHLIPNRVMHIKYPVSELKSSAELEKKNSRLLNFVADKIKNKKVRLYREPLLIFDEY
jgi:hypothetical protein